MDKITEALSKFLPADNLKEVSEAVAEMLEQAKQELEAEFNKNLEEAYEELASENQKAEEVAEEGYRQAWDVISELRNRIDVLRAEYSDALEEGYSEAYQAIVEEKQKNTNIETELYEEYEKRFEESKSYIVDKVDAFLKTKGKEIYEMAKRDIMSDPAMVEHKIVLENIVETISDYISDEDRVLATSSKLESMKKSLDESSSRIRMLEAKNIKLSSDNNKLNESIKQATELISESNKQVVTESRKARVEKAKNVTGRGDIVVENTKVIGENEPTVSVSNKTDNVYTESAISPEMLYQMQVLAGTKSSNEN